jgi:pyocin large subunit-like protein
MQVEKNVTKTVIESIAKPVIGNQRRLRAGELSNVGETLTEEEMKAVSGALDRVTWTCGSQQKADEWM